MQIKQLVSFYIAEVNKISEKFEKIFEVSKGWLRFDGIGLKPTIYNPFSVLKSHKQAGGDYKIVPVNDNEIAISWEDAEGYDREFIVPPLFFDDFEKYLENVFQITDENNKIQTAKFQEFQSRLEKEKEIEKQKQYEEFLKLKEIFEPKSLNS